MGKKILISALVACSLLAGTLSAQDGLPSREERIYSLSLIWREMAYNFVFPEKLQRIHLDSLYRAYLPKVEQAQSSYEYFRVLCAFMAHFNDAHTYVMASNRPDAEPPLKTINFATYRYLIRHAFGNVAYDDFLAESGAGAKQL